MKKQIILLLLVSAMFWIGTVAQAAIIVGRIGHVEGDIYRYMDVGKEWVPTFVDSPAGTGDILSTGAGSRAEINFPNQLVVRLAENGEVEIVNLEDGIGEFHLVAGLARFYNNSNTGTLKIRTNQGVLNLPAGSIADLQADGTSIQIWSVRGGSTFLAMASDSRTETLEVIDQSTSLTIYRNSVAAGIGPIDRSWHNWCAERENVWHERQLVRSEYMPEPLQEHAYVLQPHGRWRRVYYRGYYYWAWKPNRVAAGWAPYTSGYWYDWHGDRVWVDHNPWGWVTHHNGHWMHVHGSWMWTPYVHVAATPGVTVTSFSIVFGPRYRSHWHPGRVRWITYNDYVGWLPLAPWETYYGHRRWGPGSRVAYSGTGVNIRININLADHHYLDHAVVIPRHHFRHRGPAVINNYNTVKIKNINKKVIVKNYKPLSTMEERKHKNRKQVVRGHTTSRRRVISKHRKVDKKEVVATQKTHRSRKVDGVVLTKVKPRKKAGIAAVGKRTEHPVRVTGKKTVKRKQRSVTTRNVVQEERVSYLDKKEKRATAKRDDKRVESKTNRKRTISAQHQVVRQEKIVKKPRQKELKKDQNRRKTDEEYAAQDKQKRNERHNYSRKQETRSLDKQKTAGRKERYSMNHSGFTAPSSLSLRRGRL